MQQEQTKIHTSDAVSSPSSSYEMQGPSRTPTPTPTVEHLHLLQQDAPQKMTPLAGLTEN